MQTPFQPMQMWQSHIQRTGAPLLNQQCWCWGQDIRHPEGNLLLRYGFERHRPPDPTRGSSVYRLPLTPERTVILWGFGVLYAQVGAGGLFLADSDFTLHITADMSPLAAVHTLAELPGLHPPQTPQEWQRTWMQAATLLHWISTYERWVSATYSQGYRQTCVQGWHAWDGPRLSVKRIQARYIVPLWQQLAERCADCVYRELIESEDKHDLQSVQAASDRR